MRLRRAAELREILNFVLEAPERRPAECLADNEHPLIAHPDPLGIVELLCVLPCVGGVGGKARTFWRSTAPIAPPPHRPIVSGSPYRMGRRHAVRLPRTRA